MLASIFIETNSLPERLKPLISFCVEIVSSTCFPQEIAIPHQHIL